MLTIDVKMEEGGRWIGEVTALPGVIVYGTTDAEARQNARPSPCALLLTVSNTAERCPRRREPFLRPPDGLARNQGGRSLTGAVSDRLDRQAPVRFAPDSR